MQLFSFIGWQFIPRLKPWAFLQTFFVMNLHIYDRFIPQAKELLNRPSSNEKVDFYLNKPNQTKIEDVMAEDFMLTNYKPTKPQLKFDLAI